MLGKGRKLPVPKFSNSYIVFDSLYILCNRILHSWHAELTKCELLSFREVVKLGAFEQLNGRKW